MDENAEHEVPSEEDFLPAPPRRLHPFDVWPSWKDGRGALLFLALVGLISLVQWQFFYFLNLPKFDLSASYEQVFSNHQYWRLVTAIFAHANFEHLGNNSITLIAFSWILSAYFGMWAFPIGGLLVGIASNAATLHYYGPGTSLLGASGMNYGLVAMWLCLYLRFDESKSLPHRVMRSIAFALMMLFPQQYDPKVSYAAHVSGLICGIIYGGLCIVFLMPRFPKYSNDRKRQNLAILS